MFESVLSKGKIGSLELKNRFAVPSMGTSLARVDGHITDELIEYYTERARGGFGLIILEVCGIETLGKAIPEQIMLDDDKYIPGLKKLTDSIHEAGAKVFPQVHHAGRQAMEIVVNAQPVAPSAVQCPMTRTLPRELTVEEIHALIEKFGDAALRSKKAGFDGVEVQYGHGYLVGQFLSGASNKRSDEFGGSLIKRARFGLDIIANIREKCGPDFPIMIRLSADERVEGGMKVSETSAIAALLEKAGADAINVTTGVYGSMPWIIAPSVVEPGFNLHDTEFIKKSVKIPVMAVGKLYDPYLADNIVANGTADFIAVGRGSIADPHMPNKVMEGRVHEILPCVGCMTRCQGVVVTNTSDRGICCMVNPFAAKETKRKITPAPEKKNVVVVGGGPGGLQTAWIAAARGHNVTLLEKSGKLGGQFISGSVPPGKHVMLSAISYYHEMCKKYGVDIQLNTEADARTVLDLNPDEVVLATGALPMACPIPVKDIPVAQAVDVLNGQVPLGENILIIGGGLIGVETAELAVSQNRTVSIVEMEDMIGADMQASVRFFALKTLNEHNVKFITNTKVREINTNCIACENLSGDIELKGYDMIIIAVGSVAYNPLEEKLKDKVKSLHVIGDAVKARKAVEALEEATVLALEI